MKTSNVVRRGARIIASFVVVVMMLSCSKETLVEKEVEVDQQFGLQAQQRDKVRQFVDNEGNPFLAPNAVRNSGPSQQHIWRQFNEKELRFALYLMAANNAAYEEGKSWVPSGFGQFELRDYYFAFYQVLHEKVKKDFNYPLNHWQIESYEMYLNYIEKHGEILSTQANRLAKTSMAQKQFHKESVYESRASSHEERYLWHPCYQYKCI